MNNNKIVSELIKIAKEWHEDADVDDYRDRTIKELKKHSGGEPVFNAEKVKGKWYGLTTELGAYRIGNKYRVKWKAIGKAQHRSGEWYVCIN